MVMAATERTMLTISADQRSGVPSLLARWRSSDPGWPEVSAEEPPRLSHAGDVMEDSDCLIAYAASFVLVLAEMEWGTTAEIVGGRRVGSCGTSMARVAPTVSTSVLQRGSRGPSTMPLQGARPASCTDR